MKQLFYRGNCFNAIANRWPGCYLEINGVKAIQKHKKKKKSLKTIK